MSNRGEQEMFVQMGEQGKREKLQSILAKVPEMVERVDITPARLQHFMDNPSRGEDIFTIARELGLVVIGPEEVAKTFNCVRDLLPPLPEFSPKEIRDFELQARTFLKRGSRKAGDAALVYVTRYLRIPLAWLVISYASLARWFGKTGTIEEGHVVFPLGFYLAPDESALPKEVFNGNVSVLLLADVEARHLNASWENQRATVEFHEAEKVQNCTLQIYVALALHRAHNRASRLDFWARSSTHAVPEDRNEPTSRFILGSPTTSKLHVSLDAVEALALPRVGICSYEIVRAW